MKRNNKPVIFICLLIAFLVVVGIASQVISRYLPSRKQMDLNVYYGQVEEGKAAVIVGTQILEERGILAGEEAYLPLNVVRSQLNQRFYWDAENQQILYATPSELTFAAASAEAGGDVWLNGDTVYLKLSYIKQYTDLDTYIYQNPGRIAIQKRFNNVKTVTVNKKSYIRFRGGIKSEVLTEVPKGTVLRLMAELDEWDQVATEDGYIGYIEKKKISEPQVTDFPREFKREQYTYLSMDEPVNMVWHQVTIQESNMYFADDTANMTGVNVISPTWFSIADNSGNITDISSVDYVNQAHERGLKVWGLVDNFNVDISTFEVLSHTASRQNLVHQLVDKAVAVGMDGINIDFEALSEDVGIHFLEFLREISIECHKNNLVLSVDNPVPEDFTSHYDRAEQGRVVDYVIIMGYDEHYVGSEAGSVASLSWVEKGIQDTLKEVPAKRVINAVPFYTRLWKTSAEGVSSEAITMNQAQEVISTYNVETYWDSSAGQNYGTYEKEGATYQIWLEDAESLAAKVQLSKTYELAGVAAWKLGFENSSIWQVITERLQ